MIKKLFILLLAMLPIATSAQLISGDWYTYPTFNGKIEKMVETTGGKLYFQAGTNLFSFDSNTNELYSYTKRNLLSDNSVKSIYYNYEGKYLVVVYNNSNIDIIYDDNTVVNMSDIKDAVLASAKDINDVAFKNGKIYVATVFGLVVFDDKKHTVIESGIYNTNFSGIEVTDENIYVYDRLGDRKFVFYYSPVNDSHYSVNSFKKFDQVVSADKFFTSDDNKTYGLLYQENQLFEFKFNTDEMKVTFSPIKYNDTLLSGTGQGLQQWNLANGKAAFFDPKVADKIYYLDDNQTLKAVAIPTVVKNMNVTAAKCDENADNTFWVNKANSGVAQYAAGAEGAMLRDFFMPEASRVEKVSKMYLSLDHKHLYVSNLGPSHFKLNVNNGDANGARDLSRVTRIDNETLGFEDYTLNVASLNSPNGVGRRNVYGDGVLAPTSIAEDPDDSNTYYIGSVTEGVYKIKKEGNEVIEIGAYNKDNTPFGLVAGGWLGYSGLAVAIDRAGNLWVLAGKAHPSVFAGMELYILPSEARKKNPKDVTPEDWIYVTNTKLSETIDNSNFAYVRDVEIKVCEKSDMVFILAGYYDTRLVAIDVTSIYNNPSTNTSAAKWCALPMHVWSREVTDNTGKPYELINTVSIIEDKEGRIWLGGLHGIVEITNPLSALDENMRVKRLTVPRNDGTNFADYLLDSEFVWTMGVDPSNRKWIGTNTSGLYLVSPDGNQIIEHFTAENSYLPDNQVNVVMPDPLSNRVYIGTNYGLTFYNSSSAPAAENYSNVYAFPNPVRPDYTGWITINGLMDNSTVKIVDASGALKCQGQSEGGMFMWDGCDMTGSRVKSGVYYVYASQSSDTSTVGKAAAKILVVK